MKTLLVLIGMLITITLQSQTRMYVEVLDVSSEGCHVMDVYSDADCFIYGFQGYSGRRYNIEVVSKGGYVYQTVTGATRNIPSYRILTDAEKEKIDEMGRLLSRVRQAELNRAEQERERQEIKDREEREHAARITKLAKEIKIFEWKKEQATNGLPTFQYEVGLAYLTNSAVTDINTNLAVYWISQSAAQGNSDAKRILSTWSMWTANKIYSASTNELILRKIY